MNLAVEVVSPGDRIERIEETISLWLAAGAEGVWFPLTSLRAAVARTDGVGRPFATGCDPEFFEEKSISRFIER